MEDLVRRAFLCIEVIGLHVYKGRYDLVNSSRDIILPQVWETVVEPGWVITMHMWPMPEPEQPPVVEDTKNEAIKADGTSIERVNLKSASTRRSRRKSSTLSNWMSK